MKNTNVTVRKRAEIAKLMIWLVKYVSQNLGMDDHFGSVADDVILYAAIYISQAEHVPITALKLAHFTGIPRPTVVRKIQRWAEAGVVLMDGNRVAFPRERLHGANAEVRLSAAASRIRNAAIALSKTDT